MTLDADGTTAQHAAWSALAELYQAVVRPVVVRLEAETGIDSGVYSALAYLERAEPPGRLPLSDLARMLGVRYSQPGVSRLVQRMELDGLVERHVDPSDRRAAIVTITPHGRSRHDRAETVYRTAVSEEFGTFLDTAQADALTAALTTVLAARAASVPDLLAPPTGAAGAADEIQRQQTRRG